MAKKVGAKKAARAIAKKANGKKAASAVDVVNEADVSKALHEATIGVRFRRKVFGVEKKLDGDQTAVMADAFDASDKAVKGKKVLLDTKRPEYKRVTGRVLAAMALWREMTIPFDDPGVRLLKREKVEAFEKAMEAIGADLAEALEKLDAVYGEAIEQAKERLGDLFDASDYPKSIKDRFGFTWDYPSVDPPALLKKISPAIYEQQQKLVASKFASAVVEAQQMLAAELQKMLNGWIKKLTPVDGKKSVIRKDSLESFNSLLERIKDLSPTLAGPLGDAVKKAEKLAQGIDVESLKNKSSVAAEALKEGLESLKASVDKLVVEADDRAIVLE